MKAKAVRFNAIANKVPDEIELPRQLSEELRESGFDVVGGGDKLFEDDDAPKARFQLGGSILRWTQDLYDPLAGNRAEATVEVEWQLYDSFNKKVVLKQTSRGQYKVEPVEAGFVAEATCRSLRNLIASSDFATLVAKGAPGLASPSYTNLLEISVGKYDQPVSLPNDIDRLMDCTVVVSAGLGLASGAVISGDGYILTAAHVVSGVKEVAVKFKSGLKLTAQVVRTDTANDIALIRVPGTGYHAFSASLKAPPPVGSDLFAIGVPTGERLSFSVTKGVVSGFRQDLANPSGVSGSYIQTDASVNPGNSGGPFVDKEGKLIGICSWKLAGPAIQGLAFGVPMECMAKGLGVSWKE